MFPISLWGPVGPGLDNDRDDVKSVAANLLSLGYGGAGEAAETGEWNDALETNVREYQRAHGLTIDGLARPGGETELSLNGSLLGGNTSSRTPQSSAAGEGNDFSERFKEVDDKTDGDARTFPQRHNPFTIARTRSERESSLLPDPPDSGAKQRDPAAALFGNNSITGKPFRLGTNEQPSLAPSDMSERWAGTGVVAKLAEIATRHAQVPAPQSPPSIEEQERILTARGLRYHPDPMGRVGLGDWIDAAGRVIGDDEKERSLREGSRFPIVHTRQRDDLAPSLARDDTGAEGRGDRLVDWLRRDGRSEEQIVNLRNSDIGSAVASAFGRIEAAADAEGNVPAAVWHGELQRLGADPPEEAAVVQVSDKKDPKKTDTPSRRFNFGADAEPMADGFRRIWAWLSQDIQPLAEAKRSSLRPYDETIRALQEERKKPGLSLFERWNIDMNLAQLLITRGKINATFPSSPLDLAALGISAIGVVQIGSRTVPLFRQGNKVFDADDLAKGTWQQAKPIEKLDEYSAAEWRIYLEQKYGAENVKSITIPSSQSPWFKLRNTQNAETKIWYDERGFAIFDPVAKFDTRLPDRVKWSIDPKLHRIEAMRQLRDAIIGRQVDRNIFSPEQLSAIFSGKTSVPGYRWHHHQEFGRMQLAPENIHDKTYHIGGQGMKLGR